MKPGDWGRLAKKRNFRSKVKIIIEQLLPVATDATSLAEAPATKGIQGDVSFDPPRNVCILRGLILS
jgi:hypothetical protein